MLKRMTVWIIVVIFFAVVTPIFALDEGKSGPNPSEEAYEHANEHARFKRIENLKDKEAIKTEREARKEAEKVKREARKEKWQAGKEANKKQREMKKETRKALRGGSKKL